MYLQFAGGSLHRAKSEAGVEHRNPHFTDGIRVKRDVIDVQGYPVTSFDVLSTYDE